ncbi:hypothetical protein Q5P01_016942 [Channa striata]|uniref:Uncharacterized protein n=1 Tax=Channa striata TaxID=64152 RepID=A0AA88M8P5_CHASR|nr:hypothetical protein Q5P01_016942 [Channa striata]
MAASVFSTPQVDLPHFLSPQPSDTARRRQRFHPSAASAAEAPGPEHNLGQRVPARLSTNMPAQHNAHHHEAEHRRREQPHPQDRGRNTGWQAFCLHMRRINPHSGSHLYSFIGLWCLLNQSVKGWPDGASPAHPPQTGSCKIQPTPGFFSLHKKPNSNPQTTPEKRE